MPPFADKLKHEIRELIPVALFFLIAFELLALTQSLMLEQYGISVATFAAAALGALVVAKVVLVADHFAFVDRFPEKSLIWNVLWKTTIYFIGSLFVRYLEHLIHFWRRTESFADANSAIVSEVVWPHVVCVQIWLLVLLLIFCTSRELIRALGRDRLFGLLFPDRGVAEANGSSLRQRGAGTATFAMTSNQEITS